ICFVNSTADASLYQASLDAICRSIAETIADIQIAEHPERPQRPTRPTRPHDPTSVPLDERPVLGRGDDGEDVADLQLLLNDRNDACLNPDGDFGALTDDAVREYQVSRALAVDGIAGEQVWAALYEDTPPIPPPPGALTAKQQDTIKRIANDSWIADY